MLKKKYLLGAVMALTAALMLPFSVAQEGYGRDAAVVDQVQRAQNLYETGRTDQALKEVNAALERAAGDAEARFLKGLIYADMGRSDDAIEVFAALTADFPELPEPWNNLAVLFAEKGEFDKARQALLAAIQTHPSYSTAHENLGDLYARMAGMAYDRALEQDRRNESARLKLSAVNGLFSVPSAPVTQVAANRPVVNEPVVNEPVVSKPTPQPVVTPPAATVASNDPPSAPVVTTPAPVAQAPATVTPKPTPVTPAPEPVVAAAQPSPAPDTGAIAARVASAVRNWASAWSDQNVDGYLGSYAQSFRPSNGASRASWMRYRRERLTAPSFIQVEVSDLDVTVNDANTAVASFSQVYRSDNYEDQVRKTLTMVLDGGRWRIASEVSDAG